MTKRTTPATPRYLLPSEVAVLFHTSPKTINRWAHEGKLPFLRTLGGHRRYEERVIHDLLAQNTIPVTDNGRR